MQPLTSSALIMTNFPKFPIEKMRENGDAIGGTLKREILFSTYAQSFIFLKKPHGRG